MYIAINNAKWNKQVRQAFNYAIDKDAIINGLFQGTVVEATSPIPPLTTGTVDLEPYAYDPARARQLLADAGYADGAGIPTLVLNTTSGRYAFDKEICEAVQAQLKEIGINVQVNVYEYGTHFNILRNQKSDNYPDLAMFGWGTSTGDFDYFARFVQYSGSWPPNGYNPYYKNERVDNIIVLGAQESDAAERMQLYEEAQQLVWDDALGIWLHIDPEVMGNVAGLQGIHYRAIGSIDARWAYYE